mgnify:CR=1 FL=1
MIYRLIELKGDTIAVPQLVFSKLGIAEEYNVRVALYVLATGITDPDAVAQMSGSFVEMGGDSCVVYSLGGTRLNSIQSGYARPAIAAGKTRFVLYNRSGNELRVESRTQNLYTKTMDSTISLCAVADAGQVAVVTDSTDSVAKLTVYNSSMQQQLVWNLSLIHI